MFPVRNLTCRTSIFSSETCELRTMAIVTATLETAPAFENGTTPARWRLPLALGGFGFATAFAGSWVPSFWGDEAASVMSAERSLPSLFRMLGHVDAVHGLYYLFLHFWIGAFGASELSVRLPSALAVGVLVAGTFVLARTLASRNFAIVAAAICALLPRVSYMAEDARSYAFTAAIGVWVTVLLLALLRNRLSPRAHRLGWLGYSITMAIGTYLFLYFVLLILVHGAFVAASPEYRPRWRLWARASALAVVLSLPIVALGFVQRAQIAFLAKRGYANAPGVLAVQWFGSNPLLAVIAWTLIAAAVVGVVLARRRRSAVPLASAVNLGMLWLALPTLALLALNTLTPAYNYRYLSFCTPGVALAITAGAWILPRTGLRVAALALVVLLSVPTDVAEHTPFAKDHGSDLRQTAEYIGANAIAGDGIVFDESTARRLRPRLGMHLYPSSFSAVQDVTLNEAYSTRAGLWDSTIPVADASPQLASVNRVWLVVIRHSADERSGADLHTLESDGFAVTSRHLVHRTIVYLLERQP
ncbi:MAG: hypothetical protein EPN91_04620 [Salinibacterium sp.]|nr:MAG: hypothetical protein EPN91_04620 [Salinibacterium sp.]